MWSFIPFPFGFGACLFSQRKHRFPASPASPFRLLKRGSGPLDASGRGCELSIVAFRSAKVASASTALAEQKATFLERWEEGRSLSQQAAFRHGCFAGLRRSAVAGAVGLVIVLGAGLIGVVDSQEPERPVSQPAGNEAVARVMEEFVGRGDLGDGSAPSTPEKTLSQLHSPDDLVVDLVAAEPLITQPLHITFDFFGRMWVTQYRQYPFPAGLKVIRYDEHLRAVFDRIPAPPPQHVPGQDRVTVLEDTTGDGIYDRHRDVISDLNIATSTAVTVDGIWVLNPPYLLFYPDRDRDGLPDGPPEVHLSGFGLEDTHAVANSLRWAPDGWLYGVNGSTTTAAIRAERSSEPQQVTRFLGQCVWRYHPGQHRFEIFAEGGGNTFGLEWDQQGLVFSGTNHGKTRGMFYPQGSYAVKSWGKHGPLTNPYAFGFFQHMQSQGDERRFTQSLAIYQDDQLPLRYQGQVIAINPLQRLVIGSQLNDDGSTFATVDFERTIDSQDRWFRPVNVAVGPDGAVYLADWYDTRLTHVDPRDTWHKTSGRIYRIKPKTPPAADAFADLLPSRTRFDLFSLPTEALLRLLGHPSRTLRFLVIEVLVDRADSQLEAELGTILSSIDDPRRLAALWILSRRDWLSAEQRLSLLQPGQPDPHLRRWMVRLLGDAGTCGTMEAEALSRLAGEESDLRVRSQLASTARRLPVEVGLAIVDRLTEGSQVTQDPHLPLLLWWAVEGHCQDDAATVLRWLVQRDWWNRPWSQEILLERLMRRFAAAGDPGGYASCTELLRAAPDDQTASLLLRGFEEAFAGRSVDGLPDELRQEIRQYSQRSTDGDLNLLIRQGDAEAIKQAIDRLSDQKMPLSKRVQLIGTLGETKQTAALAKLKQLVRADRSQAIQRAALEGLARFDDPQIADTVVAAYRYAFDDGSNLREIAIRTLAGRRPWAKKLIAEIDAARIGPERVAVDVVLQMRLHDDAELNVAINRIWGQVRSTPKEKQQAIENIHRLLAMAGEQGDLVRGGQLFAQHCGKCHRLFGEGGNVGPDLTGYERSNLDFLTLAIVDPSAAIREEYTTYRVVTDDGQVLTGLLEEQTPQTITLRSAEGQAMQLDRDGIETLAASAVSLMPEDLLTALTEQQVLDLFAYLRDKDGLREPHGQR